MKLSEFDVRRIVLFHRERMQRETMKVILLGLMLMFVAGCQKHLETPHVMSNAAYVRQNHCVTRGTGIPDFKLFKRGSVHTVYGSKVYRCPNGVDVVINNDEEQP